MEDTTIGQKILEILEPYFGSTMAASTLKLACRDVGVEREAIQDANILSFAQDIEKRMKIFLGTDKSKAVADMIRAIKA